MDKTIVTALLIIAGVVSAVAMFNALYPAIMQSNDAITGMERRADDRMKTQIEIIHATKPTTSSDVLVWVKNVGSIRIVGADLSDVFFGPEGNFARIPYGTGTPHWEYTIENASDWTPAATLRINIVGYPTLVAGARYFIKISLPNGIGAEEYFSWQ